MFGFGFTYLTFGKSLEDVKQLFYDNGNAIQFDNNNNVQID